MTALALRLHDQAGGLAQLTDHAVVRVGRDDDIALLKILEILRAFADAQICRDLFIPDPVPLYQDMPRNLHLDQIRGSGNPSGTPAVSTTTSPFSITPAASAVSTA